MPDPPRPPFSDADARAYRERHGLPLAWSADCPPPPLSRVAFTRILLNAAHKSGLGYPEPDAPVCAAPRNEEDDVPEVAEFQERMERHLERRTVWGVPYGFVRVTRDEFREAGVRPWREYIGILEADYYDPWRDAWVYGASPDSRERAMRWLRDHFARPPVDPQLARDLKGMIAGFPPDPERLDQLLRDFLRDDETRHRQYALRETVSADTRVADFLTLKEGEHLSLDINYRLDLQLPLTQNRFLGYRGRGAHDLPEILGALFAVVTVALLILGSLRGWYVGWWLLLFLPLALVASVFVWGKLLDLPRPHWIDPRLTFGELAERIVAEKTRRWEVLRRVYAHTAREGYDGTT